MVRHRLLTFGLMLAAATAAAQPQLTVEQRLERLERRVELITDLTLQLQALRQENQQLRGQLEVQQHQLQTLERKQRDLYLDVDQRLGALQAAGAKPAAPTAAPAPAPVSDATPTVAPPPTAPPPTAMVTPPQVSATTPAPAQPPIAPPPADPAAEKVAYDAAYDLLRPQQRRYQEAAAAFTDFLARYPNSDLAPNARYWLAEANYVTGANDAALVAFREVVERYPDSAKAPGAWLKIGYILHAQGKTDEAREVLSRVVRDYSSSPAAGMARQRLERIDSERH